MYHRLRCGLYALIGCVLGLGGGIAVEDGTGPETAAAPERAARVLTLAGPRAEAGEVLQKRKQFHRKRREEERKAAEEARRKALEEKYKGAKQTELPADCAVDHYESSVTGVDTFVCGGLYYKPSKVDGAAGYEGHPVGLDREEVEKATARQAAAEKKKQEEAKKKLEASRRTELPDDCAYDSYASSAAGKAIYSCAGATYREFEEKGKTGFEIVKP